MTETSSDANERREFLKGIASALGYDVLVVVVCSLLSMTVALIVDGWSWAPTLLKEVITFSAAVVGVAVTLGIGLTHWLWLWPLIVRERANGNSSRAKGLFVCGCVISLLNATCYGLVLRH